MAEKCVNFLTQKPNYGGIYHSKGKIKSAENFEITENIKLTKKSLEFTHSKAGNH
jgi:hypothetical protein